MTAELIGAVRVPDPERPVAMHDQAPEPFCREIMPAAKAGWSGLALGEWELGGSGFGDCHPHDEINYVLEGALVVTCDGERVKARAGDLVRVPAGRPAWYEAEPYARMLYIYGPNPDGRASVTLLSRDDASKSPDPGACP